MVAQFVLSMALYRFFQDLFGCLCHLGAGMVLVGEDIIDLSSSCSSMCCHRSPGGPQKTTAMGGLLYLFACVVYIVCLICYGVSCIAGICSLARFE